MFILAAARPRSADLLSASVAGPSFILTKRADTGETTQFFISLYWSSYSQTRVL